MHPKQRKPQAARPEGPQKAATPPVQRLQWEPGALLAPVPPVLVTCGQGEDANIITVAWAGILSTKPPKTYISLRPQRHSYNIIKESRQFAVNLPTAHMARQVDLCGVKSGRDIDKFALCGFGRHEAHKISAPLIEGCPVSLECRVEKIVKMGSHDMFVADIVSVAVDPAMVDRSGRLKIEQCNLLAYAHGTYFSLGQALGTFGFSVRKKTAKGRPKNQKK